MTTDRSTTSKVGIRILPKTGRSVLLPPLRLCCMVGKWMAGQAQHAAWRNNLQNETHRAEIAELVGIDEHAPLFDAKTIAAAPQHGTIATDILANALVASEAI